jgi:hypothetical protein
MNNTEKGMLGGGAIGGIGGALVGNAVGRPGAGAAIGAGLGAVTGGLIGNSKDKEELQQAQAMAARGPLSLAEVIQMAQQHISDDIIIGQIRTTGSVYHLTPSDIVTLKQNGVSDVVVREMQLTATRPARRIYSATPVYRYEPVYVVQPPPPPVSVGVGLGYTHIHRGP